jgi:hypothetical protein
MQFWAPSGKSLGRGGSTATSGMEKAMFKNWNEKNRMYNKLFNSINQQKDPELARKMGKLFDEIRRLNREWEKLEDAAAIAAVQLQ